MRTWVLPRRWFSTTFRQLYVRKKCGRSEEAALLKKLVKRAEGVRSRCGKVRKKCGTASEEVRKMFG